MKSKKANAQGTLLLILVGILVVGLIGGVIYYATGTKQTAVSGSDQAVEGSDGSLTLVTTNPIIRISGSDRQSSGTAVTTTGSQYSTDSDMSFSAVTLGTTTATPGQKVRLLLVNDTTYHNTIWNKDGEITVKAGTFPVNVEFDKNATMTENIFYLNEIMSNGIGSANISDLGNGKSYSLTDEMQIDALTSTGEMVCVIELTAGVNASSDSPGVTFGGKLDEGISTSGWYTPASVNSRIYTFTQDAISDTNPVSKNILLSAKSNGRFSATTYMLKSCYTKEWFVDTTSGKLTYDVADSQGNLKSMAVYTYTVYFE